MKKEKLLLVGAGYMAKEYAKVLCTLDIPFDVAGRGKVSAQAFSEEVGVPVISDGLQVLEKEHRLQEYDAAIVATSVDQLAETTITLAAAGISDVLLEKPGGRNFDEIISLDKQLQAYDTRVFIRYNRRNYASTQKAKKIITEDGGVTSFQFEFTEWSHVIEPLEKSMDIKQQWFLTNSTHVVDLAFYLGGYPEEMHYFTAGSLPWHSVAARFAGAGISQSGASFSYSADWTAPGRWGVEIMTAKHRLIFRPLEQLKIQNIEQVQISDVPLDDCLDREFKPGLYKELQKLLGREENDMMTLEEQCRVLPYYRKILHPYE